MGLDQQLSSFRTHLSADLCSVTCCDMNVVAQHSMIWYGYDEQ
jgi:hypothetical protein